MTTARFSLCQEIESRTASLAKDSYSKNCYFETTREGRKIKKRPGTSTVTVTPAIPAGQSQGMFSFNILNNNTLYVAANNFVYSVALSGTSANLGTMTGPIAGCSFNQTSTFPYTTVQNGSHLYTITTGGTFAVASQLDTILSGLSLSTSGLAKGIVYLNGYTYVMTTTARIYTSSYEDPTTWNALNYTTASAEPDGGVGIVKHFNYLVAFGQWSTEFFYFDSTTITGSYLSNMASYRMEIGCADGGTIAQIEQSLLWVGASKTQGRSVFLMNGVSPVKVSTPYIEKYLNASVGPGKAYAFKWSGHTFYVLAIHDLDLTFVYDVDEKTWYNWSYYVPAGTTSTAVAGVAVAGKATAGSTGGSYAGAEHYFRPTYYASFNNTYYLLDDDNGNIYTLSDSIYQDAGNPLYFEVITSIMDSGTTKRKFFRRLEIIGDKVSSNMLVAHSGNDYATWSAFRTVDLSKERAKLDVLGSDRRRAWKFLDIDNSPLRLDAVELTFDIGDMAGQGGS